MDADTRLFRPETELAEEYDTFKRWPPPERLMVKCSAVVDVAMDGMAATARDMRRRMHKVIDRAERRGLITGPQAEALRLTLSVSIRQ